MSQLENNTATLQSILDTVKALPDAGTGGSSVETCTVELVSANTTYAPVCVAYTALLNGVVSSVYVSQLDGTTYTINDVLCDSIIVVQYEIKHTGFTVENGECLKYIEDIAMVCRTANVSGSITTIENGTPGSDKEEIG